MTAKLLGDVLIWSINYGFGLYLKKKLSTLNKIFSVYPKVENFFCLDFVFRQKVNFKMYFEFETCYTGYFKLFYYFIDRVETHFINFI